MLPLVFNFCYVCLVLLVLPLVMWKRLRTGKYRRGWSQKLWGNLPEPKSDRRPRIWLHAVSVGEVLQLQQVVDRLKQACPEASLFISTTTETGYDVAVQKFPECETGFFPLDFTWSMNRALNRVRPDLIVLVELELWPNFIFAAARRGIPLALINGRLSERSFRSYGRLRWLAKRLLGSFTVIGVQTVEYRDRFVHLGASAALTVVTGSIKFDGVVTNHQNGRTRELAAWMEIPQGAPVLIAGSTQDPEERYSVQAYQELLAEFPELRLVIVPRHPERRDELVEMIHQYGFPVRLRSTGKLLEPPANAAGTIRPVIHLLDTVGELGACWGLARVAFVGGSFTNRGGQNMLEPAAFGAAVCFGPNTWNFKQIVEILRSQEAVQTVRSQIELQEFVREMLRNPERASAMGARAKSLVLSQQGATDRTVQLLLQALQLPVSQKEDRAA